jgi:hypothetical protein
MCQQLARLWWLAQRVKSQSNSWCFLLPKNHLFYAVVIYVVANTICMAWGVKSVAQFISITNLVSLFAGAQLYLTADALGA